MISFFFFLIYWNIVFGPPGWLSGKESACHCRRCRFDPWLRKMPWRRTWQPTSGFLPGESHDRGVLWATVHGVTKELDTTERLKQPTNHTLSKLEPHRRRFLETSAYLGLRIHSEGLNTCN